MRALIIANGSLPPAETVKYLARSADHIVCADGGSRHAFRLHIRPHIVLGDLDSHRSSPRRASPRTRLLHLPDQNRTDLQKAIDYLIANNYHEIDIVGAFGDRIDHCTVTLGCFRRYRRRAHLRLFDPEGILVLVNRRMRFTAQIGERISLIPWNRCTGVTTLGLQYSLRNESLAPGVRDGISNVAIAGRVSITYSRGILLLYRSWSSHRSAAKAAVG